MIRGGSRRGAGRPPGSRDKAPRAPRAPETEVVSLRVPVATMAAIDERAAEVGQTRTEYVRALLERAAKR